jgi:hypothetical protein
VIASAGHGLLHKPQAVQSSLITGRYIPKNPIALGSHISLHVKHIVPFHAKHLAVFMLMLAWILASPSSPSTPLSQAFAHALQKVQPELPNSSLGMPLSSINIIASSQNVLQGLVSQLGHTWSKSSQSSTYGGRIGFCSLFLERGVKTPLLE